MHEILPYSPPDTGGITRANLLRRIWTAPQATLTYLLANSIDEHVYFFFVLGGIARAVASAAADSPSKMGDSPALLAAIIGGGISGSILYAAYSWAMGLVGSWLGGKAPAKQFKIVLGWALVPTISTLILSTPVLYILNGEFASNSLLADALLMGCGLAQIGLGVWGIVILIKGIMIIQGFSIGRALANVALPGAVVVGLILLTIFVRTLSR